MECSTEAEDRSVASTHARGCPVHACTALSRGPQINLPSLSRGAAGLCRLALDVVSLDGLRAAPAPTFSASSACSRLPAGHLP